MLRPWESCGGSFFAVRKPSRARSGPTTITRTTCASRRTGMSHPPLSKGTTDRRARCSVTPRSHGISGKRDGCWSVSPKAPVLASQHDVREQRPWGRYRWLRQCVTNGKHLINDRAPCLTSARTPAASRSSWFRPARQEASAWSFGVMPMARCGSRSSRILRFRSNQLPRTQRTSRQRPTFEGLSRNTSMASNHAGVSGNRRRPAVRSRVATLSHEAIAQRAYDLFLRRGQAHGHALDDWLQAERELRKGESKPVATRLRGSSRRSPTKL